MADPTEPLAQASRGPDYGPIYTETPTEIRWGQTYPGTIAEPWNAATAFLFVLIVVFWLIRLRGRLLAHPFLAVSLPILFVGGVGGTLYHGLRTLPLYFYLDVIPIQVLGLAVSLYVWVRLGPKLSHLLVMLAVLALLTSLGHFTLPAHYAINLSYASLALLILIPLVVALIRTRCFQAGWVATALVAFGMAWFCRLADPWEPPLLPMGTHWLWHTFGAATTLALSEYMYRLERVSLRAKPPAAGSTPL
ncbi:MAG TPA: hypothetical protein VM597_06220 [Gemmataceae bacterium]|nr:hypothetical protein [Gemmataceae bacterium]